MESFREIEVNKAQLATVSNPREEAYMCVEILCFFGFNPSHPIQKYKDTSSGSWIFRQEIGNGLCRHSIFPQGGHFLSFYSCPPISIYNSQDLVWSVVAGILFGCLLWLLAY